MSQPISNLPLLAVVKDPLSKFSGTPLRFLVGDKNHTGYPTDSVSMLFEKAPMACAFDAKEATNPLANRQSSGNNNYLVSNVRQYLNKSTYPWYVAQHINDAPPSGGNVSANPYDTTAGFLHYLSPQLLETMLATSLVFRKHADDGGGDVTFTDKLFLLSLIEMGLQFSTFPPAPEGGKWAVFNTDASRVCYSLNGSPCEYWTRSMHFYNNTIQNMAFTVTASGTVNQPSPFTGTVYIRPAFNVPGDAPVSDTPDSDGAYTFIWNAAPTPPPSLFVPESIRVGRPVSVTWGASSDPEGDPVTYELERSVNAAAYASAYAGAATTHTETAGADWFTVQHRVRAKDKKGAASAYATGPLRNVIRNVDPTISGTDTDLGEITAPPSYAYQADDTDASDSITVTESLDGKTLRTIPDAARGTRYTLVLTREQFFSCAAGQHRLTITVTDSFGNAAARNVAFTRLVACVDFDTPVKGTDAAAEQILVNMRVDPPDAPVELLVCNNAYDADPVWEAASLGRKHIMSNKSKTAAEWGVRLRVKATPTADCPPCGVRQPLHRDTLKVNISRRPQTYRFPVCSSQGLAWFMV